jgi:hypothetical protein
MKIPKKVGGYDVVVWMSARRVVRCAAYTDAGDRFLKSLDPDYESVMEIRSDPDTFMREVPPSISVGFINPKTKRVYTMPKNTTH